MKNLAISLVGLGLLLTGCTTTPPSNEAEVLAGRWTVTPEEPGDIEGAEYEAEFDSSGNLVELSATTPDGGMARLMIDDATTEVDGSNVTITIPKLAGAKVFEGTLSEDQNTITGSITEEVNLGDLELVLPGGNITFERITS